MNLGCLYVPSIMIFVDKRPDIQSTCLNACFASCLNRFLDVRARVRWYLTADVDGEEPGVEGEARLQLEDHVAGHVQLLSVGVQEVRHVAQLPSCTVIY